MEKAQVICSNDAVKGVVLRTKEEAKIHMKELKKIDFKRYQYQMSFKAYEDLSFWHLHEVPMYGKEGS